MILSDRDIHRAMADGKIVITPFHKACLGSNSYDVHLGKTIGIYNSEILDAKKENELILEEIPEKGKLLIPDELYLATTIEYTETYDFVPFLEGKSSTGRLGISIHETAGKGDDGFRGHWTLEIRVAKPVIVYHKMPIGQLMYHTLSSPSVIPYDKKGSAKYSNQAGIPVESKMWKNFNDDPIWRD